MMGTPELEAYAFQSLTGRLQTKDIRDELLGYCSFNPSQVGYKQDRRTRIPARFGSFNPSQVGYKQIAPGEYRAVVRVSIPHR